MTRNETVEVSREVLVTLIQEAENAVESIEDEEWHTSPRGKKVHSAISIARVNLE